MKNTLHLVIIILASVISGCKDNDYSSFVFSNLSEISPEYKNCDSIFIIPRKGCNSCTNLADKIFITRKNNFDNLYIFTNLVSKKDLRIRLGNETLKQKNIIVDSDNRFWNQNFVECQYPTLFIKKPDGSFHFEYLLDSVE